MIRTLFLSFVLAFATASFAQPETSTPVKISEDVTATNATLVCSKDTTGKLLCKPLESGDVEFTTQNLIVLRGPIMPESASKFVKDFHELEHRDEVQRIYIYVKSPGGSIFAGDYITNILRASKKEVVVIIDFAASMAFHISHFGSKRLMLPTGTMMQHHASGGTGRGEFPNVDKQWNWIKRKVSMMNKFDAAACKNTSYNEFMTKIDRDWWLLSEEALEAGCIDGVATSVTCSKDLMEKVVREEFSFFGMKILVTWSGCPLETYPREIKARKAGGFRLTAEQRVALDEFILLLADPLQYYNTRGSFNLDRYYQVEETKTPGNE